MTLPTPNAFVRLAVLSGSMLLAPTVFAASTWDLSGNAGTGCSQGATNANTYGNSWSCTSSGAPTATGTAYSTTNDGTATPSSTGTKFAIANLAMWQGSGFGVQNQIETTNAGVPNHSLDNGGATDVLLLSFASSVSLSSISLGWSQTDSDISVLRYTGSTPPAIVGTTTASLLTSGWQLVGNYADVTGVTSSSSSNPGGTVNVNSAGKSSSWWLISAYNSGYGSVSESTSSSSSLLSNGNDYIKVLSVAGTPTPTTTKVPEPTSAPLVGLAFLAMAWVSRRSLVRTKA